jgi:cytochrome c oxidase subunit 2
VRGRLVAACAPLAAGCAGRPLSPLHTAAGEAESILALGTTHLAIAVGVYVLVIGVLLWGVWRRRRPTAEAALLAPDPEGERAAARAVGGGVAATTVIIAIYVALAFDVGAALEGPHRAVGGAHGDADAVRHDIAPLVIEVVGRQWWWEMRYQDSVPSESFVTANELHVPVGRPVVVLLRSDDVIHSFSVPALTGKRDLTPGHTNTLRFTPTTPGTFMGQCAEYCGFQHAHMAFDVVVHEPATYQAWVDRQRQPAPAPADSARARGRQVFLTRACPMCHAIQGTAARGSVGPDLTHVGSRRSLAAGALPNTPGHLAGWILDPQRQKPGTRMPPNDIAGPDLEALVAYLRSLE